MPGMKELKGRMASVRNTQKITNAMYLIASAKMRKAREELSRTRPYFTALQAEIKRIFRTDERVENRYFYPPQGEKKLEGPVGCLVVTADKGLAGAYNQNIIKATNELSKEHGGDVEFFVVGEYGRQYCLRHEIAIRRSFLYTAQNPTLHRAREIANVLLEAYDSGSLKKIFIIYTDLGKGMDAEVRVTRLLPFHRAQFSSAGAAQEDHTPFEFLPSVGEVLNNIIPSYLTGFIYSALVDSFCCEQNARMTAMDAANRNAQKILDELQMRCNHVRQGAITQEITEISAGAQAQRNREELS
ncbi:MAG TPA: ATP synthase F1 subunit gamma [Candidatus Gallimonas intestinigallinarum]|uniref:ATP synthase gamma chain n=1 Tax=Candidatus Gallimonas intestinigallinarum TaxID=2838604 RepID=A0A9D2DWP0_9FIRM|nr:ATP synthase F1 subunit gamma [Candidatus Gallimonas intestinigallinarum]